MLYDTAVDFRIRFEPILSLARSFPLPPTARQDEMDHASSSTTLPTCCSSLVALAESLDSAAASLASNAPSEVRWEYDRLDTAAAAGATPTVASFKAIDARPSAQIARSLATGKHLSRARRVRADIPLHNGGVLAAGACTTNIASHYDDGELYRALLREVVEALPATTPGKAHRGDSGIAVCGTGLRYAQLAKTGRVRKKIDRKANKGRRLRYVEHPKIVGFLAPTPLADPGPVDEIVSGLFGKLRG